MAVSTSPSYHRYAARSVVFTHSHALDRRSAEGKFGHPAHRWAAPVLCCGSSFCLRPEIPLAEPRPFRALHGHASMCSIPVALAECATSLLTAKFFDSPCRRWIKNFAIAAKRQGTGYAPTGVETTTDRSARRRQQCGMRLPTLAAAFQPSGFELFNYNIWQFAATRHDGEFSEAASVRTSEAFEPVLDYDNNHHHRGNTSRIRRKCAARFAAMAGRPALTMPHLARWPAYNTRSYQIVELIV